MERAIQSARQGQKQIVSTGIKTWFWAGAFLLAIGSVSGIARAAADDLTFFETKIRPLLATHCYACHDETMSAGGQRLDVLPESPSTSFLSLLQQRDASGHPDVAFSVQEREAIRAWISQGAPWPKVVPENSRNIPMVEYVREMQETHWAFKPVTRPTVAEAAGAPFPIDAFIRERLSGTGLAAQCRGHCRV